MCRATAGEFWTPEMKGEENVNQETSFFVDRTQDPRYNQKRKGSSSCTATEGIPQVEVKEEDGQIRHHCLPPPLLA